ncbi:hypothetical protein CN902_10985 [Priestia megaterium]|uniref:DUF4145 domain-containing protein n=1 Tax=Priestia megaterium TaxID=1404 RepID=UPI000BFB5FDB|nr:DUF4145 domain-containing protein [Priestia megaterium]PGK30626.1 hypothetical protein CN902_10985 [Priestia megaterium]
MDKHYIPPVYGERKFNCPSCQAFAHQEWSEIIEDPDDNELVTLSYVLRNASRPSKMFESSSNGFRSDNHVALSLCFQCDQYSLWKYGKLVYPLAITAPLPNPDMPDDIKKLYEEARQVWNISPMASTAILRLALEMLLPQIGSTKGNINNMIGELVKKGLPKQVEKALDSLRVIGNEAVHPGTINLKDNEKMALAMFKMLNFVVDQMITQIKEINEIYDLLPEDKLKGIEERNNKILKGE